MGLLANLDYEVQKYFHEIENECDYLKGYDIASNCLETIAFFSKETLETTIDILLKYNFDKEITCYYTEYDGDIMTAEGKMFSNIEEGENEHTIMLTEIMNGTNIGDFNQIFYKLDEVLNFWLLKELGLNETNYQFYNLCWQSSEPEILLNLINSPNQLTDQHPQIDSLQAENDRLKAENERLTAELNKKPTTPAKDELSPKTQKAITKLLYALLVEHGYELGAKKGNTNDILQSLTQKHGVELSREFIATQLDKVNKLEKT